VKGQRTAARPVDPGARPHTPTRPHAGARSQRLEERNEKGQTALHVASLRSSKELPELLTKAGADHTAVEQNPRSLSRDTSEIIATKSGHPVRAALTRTRAPSVRVTARCRRGAHACGGGLRTRRLVAQALVPPSHSCALAPQETAAYLKSLNTTLAAVSFAGKLKKGKGA
jgi:hypothetical protein